MVNGMIVSHASIVLLIVLCVLLAALIALVIVLLIRQNRQKERLDKFMKGQDGTSIEASIADKFSRLKILEEKDAAEDAAIRDLYDRLKDSYQKTGAVKYDAFMENGGSLSFAFCFLDGHDSGIIMNVMNGRDGSYCYLKEVDRGSCQITLGKEEQEALDMALYSR